MWRDRLALRTRLYFKRGECITMWPNAEGSEFCKLCSLRTVVALSLEFLSHRLMTTLAKSSDHRSQAERMKSVSEDVGIHAIPPSYVSWLSPLRARELISCHSYLYTAAGLKACCVVIHGLARKARLVNAFL